MSDSVAGLRHSIKRGEVGHAVFFLNTGLISTLGGHIIPVPETEQELATYRWIAQNAWQLNLRKRELLEKILALYGDT